MTANPNQEDQPDRISKERERKEAIEDFIIQLYASHDSIPADRYPWLYESDRWYELVFCLLNRISPEWMPSSVARDVTEELATEGLLDVPILAGAESPSGKPTYTAPELTAIQEVLLGAGYDAEETETAVQTIYEMAEALQEQHDGRIQRYLRQYGELMLKEVDRTFSFTRMSDADVHYMFTHWLQNVLNMPVALSNPAVKAVCDTYDITVEELVSAADRLGVNVALLDDLMEAFASE